MKIRDLKIGNYVVVNDLGAGKYSSGMRVIGKVIKIDDKHNYAIIESLPKHRYEITDFNDFELWAKNIEDKTESVSIQNKETEEIVSNGEVEATIDLSNSEFAHLRQSNDLQQRKRNDTVNHPSHYNYGDIEVIDYCDQVCKTYPPELAPYVFNAIKYLSRANMKNGREDIAKAKYFVERLFDKWE
ncbi:DUF3310 domain-containing protein [Staphylococcus saprophyticus]|uniref:DUF3310 domain-containing protein n=1 Tax=Staphylococcus saprophyticus TaxID=29385 RepID=UPI001F0B9800|nr:DUF3310 domain-containing protein [Staphylococcus saprophyticus]